MPELEPELEQEPKPHPRVITTIIKLKYKHINDHRKNGTLSIHVSLESTGPSLSQVKTLCFQKYETDPTFHTYMYPP